MAAGGRGELMGYARGLYYFLRGLRIVMLPRIRRALMELQYDDNFPPPRRGFPPLDSYRRPSL
ncbi:MAG TPA: hypothetical protein PKD21_10455, partial [Candidatus Competibacter phosphatis]|nr:hypothetical protein [Candidatus Competibacter phosphatis]